MWNGNRANENESECGMQEAASRKSNREFSLVFEVRKEARNGVEYAESANEEVNARICESLRAARMDMHSERKDARERC